MAIIEFEGFSSKTENALKRKLAEVTYMDGGDPRKKDKGVHRAKAKKRTRRAKADATERWAKADARRARKGKKS